MVCAHRSELRLNFPMTDSQRLVLRCSASVGGLESNLETVGIGSSFTTTVVDVAESWSEGGALDDLCQRVQRGELDLAGAAEEALDKHIGGDRSAEK